MRFYLTPLRLQFKPVTDRFGISTIVKRFSSTTPLNTSFDDSPHSPGNFNPKRVLILTKLSRLEFEKFRNSSLNDVELEHLLRKRGSDYSSLLYHHYIHKGCENRIEKCFKEFDVETKVVNRFEYTDEAIDWADLIVAAGGDGTFLMAASRIHDRSKPIVGFNTDPTRSAGHLCLPKSYSVNIRDAVKKIIHGHNFISLYIDMQRKFKWTFRRRIRVTLLGEKVFEKPVELHDQQLKHPEYRFFDCYHEQQKSVDVKEHPQKRVLPVLALNEVYVGENVSARVSYFEVAVNDGERIKTKNAGLCVSTGTGSTSWAYNINKVSTQMVESICDIMAEEGYKELNLKPTKNQVERVTSIYNNRLIFDPEDCNMLYTIRDPISSYTLPYAFDLVPRAFADRIEVRSRCYDACVVIDGGLSFSFNDGTVALLEMHNNDALRCIVSF